MATYTPITSEKLTVCTLKLTVCIFVTSKKLTGCTFRYE